MRVGLVLLTLVVAFGGGLVPFINVEVWVVGVSAVCPGATLVPVVLAASLGQVAAKILLYRAGGGAASWGSRHRGRGGDAVPLPALSRPRSRGTAAALHRGLPPPPARADAGDLGLKGRRPHQPSHERGGASGFTGVLLVTVRTAAGIAWR
jgi:hypothetical protein